MKSCLCNVELQNDDCKYYPESPHDYCAIGNSAKKFACKNCPPPPCLPCFPSSPPCPPTDCSPTADCTTAVGTTTVGTTTVGTTTVGTTPAIGSTTPAIPPPEVFPWMYMLSLLVVFLIFLCIINIYRTRRKSDKKNDDSKALLYPPSHPTKTHYEISSGRKATGKSCREPDHSQSAFPNPAFDEEENDDDLVKLVEEPTSVSLGCCLVIGEDETKASGSSTRKTGPPKVATSVVPANEVDQNQNGGQP